MSDCEERIYSIDKGIEITKIGLYLIRGDNIALFGLIINYFFFLNLM